MRTNGLSAQSVEPHLMTSRESSATGNPAATVISSFAIGIRPSTVELHVGATVARSAKATRNNDFGSIMAYCTNKHGCRRWG